tara:strand:+ start:319 stop:828 length:510 start_codon:yes stop_codon:yes gene_type:complete
MKLHIGGKEAKEGWKILNIQKNENVDFIGDISDLTQFEKESVEIIYASHVLEHVEQKKVLETLKGVHRILKQNGEFYISVPDLDILCKAFISPKLNLEQRISMMRMMFGGQIDKYDFHYFGWNQEIMVYFLNLAGFKKLKKVESFNLFKDTSDYKPFGIPISLNVIATK